MTHTPTAGPSDKSVIQRTPCSIPVKVATPTPSHATPESVPMRSAKNTAVVDTTTPLNKYWKKPATISHRCNGRAHADIQPPSELCSTGSLCSDRTTGVCTAPQRKSRANGNAATAATITKRMAL